MGEPRLLSSRLTFWMKFVYSSLWIALFGTGTVAAWLSGSRSPGSPPWLKWWFLGLWLGGSVLIWWLCVRLKRGAALVRISENPS